MRAPCARSKKRRINFTKSYTVYSCFTFFHHSLTKESPSFFYGKTTNHAKGSKVFDNYFYFNNQFYKLFFLSLERDCISEEGI